MPVFDRDRQRIVVRVVYDGPANAGKTTNLAQLCRFFTTTRRGELIAPEERAGRTLFFDWLELDGGLVGGFRLRCQLVTVPGQAVLSHRRRYLLDKADVIVFVCESTRAGLDIGRRMIEVLRPRLELSPDERVPVVLQANKQDLAGALTSDQVASSLGLPMDAGVVAARASDGIGVRETLVLAIRAAANQAQRRILSHGMLALPTEVETSEVLHAMLLNMKPTSGSRAALALSYIGSCHNGPSEHSSAQSSREAAGEEGDRRPAQAAEAPGRGEDPVLPTSDSPAGLVWPAARGRRVLRTLDGQKPARRDDLVGRHGRADGSGASDALIFQVGPLCLKTSRRRWFSDVEQGRLSMVLLARRKTQLGALLHPETTLCLQPGRGGGAWLWTITPWTNTLRSEMESGEERSDAAALARALEGFAEAAAAALVLAAREHLILDVHPSNFARYGSGVVYLDDDIAAGKTVPAIGHSLLRRVDEYVHWPEAIERYIERLSAALGTELTVDERQQVGLKEAMQHTILQSDAARAARERLSAAIGS